MSKSNRRNRQQLPDISPEGLLHVRREYSGTLPPPDFFAGYNRVVPTAAERILVMAEEQQRSSISKDDRLLTIQEKNEEADREFAKYGQFVSFICTMSVIVVGSIVMILSLFMDNQTPFYWVFSAGALFGLAKIIRSFQTKGTTNVPVKK